jgi:hypothetical protein
MSMLMTMPLAARDDEPARLTMRVTPWVAIAPADVIVRAMVGENELNRSIEIIAESVDFYRSSEMSLDGRSAPRTTQVALRGLPGGIYQVRVILKGANDRQLAAARQQVNIVSSVSER